ncbi:MAG: hypothetical protein ACXW08_15490 [Solirubrobacteraceae bacterium]
MEEDPLEPVREVEHGVDDRRQRDERDGREEQAPGEEDEQDRILPDTFGASVSTCTG